VIITDVDTRCYGIRVYDLETSIQCTCRYVLLSVPNAVSYWARRKHLTSE